MGVFGNILKGIGRSFGGTGDSLTGYNAAISPQRKLEDEEFQQLLRQQATGQNLGPNIAAQTGQDTLATVRDDQRAGMQVAGAQQNAALANIRAGQNAALADVASQQQAGMAAAQRQTALAQEGARNAATSQAASGRGAGVAAARYAAANQGAAAQLGIGQQAREAQTQLASQAAQTQASLGRTASTAYAAANRDASVERQRLLTDANNTRAQINRESTTAASKENQDKIQAGRQAYGDVLKTNLESSLTTDEINARRNEGNATRKMEGTKNIISGLGTMAMGAISDVKAKEDIKPLGSSEPKPVYLGDGPGLKQRNEYGPNAADYRASKSAGDVVGMAKKDDEAENAKRMAAFSAAFSALSDKDAKEDRSPATEKDFADILRQLGETNPDKTRDVFDKLEPYEYRYKEADAERMARDFDDPRAAYDELRKPRAGVMAQDMAKSEEGKKAVFKSDSDRLAIYGPKALSLALAEIADLHARLEELEGKKNG